MHTGLLAAEFGSEFWATDLQTIVVGATGNAACAILGCFLLLRRMSLLGDAVSHSILAGIAAAFLLTGTTSIVPMFAGAMVAGVLTAVLTQALHSLGRVPEDSSMGVVFTSMFAVGVIIISQLGRVHLDTDCVLYGRLDTVSLETTVVAGYLVPRALLSLVPVLAATLLFVSLLWKELKITSFDPQLATAAGFSAVGVHYLLMTMVATSTVASLNSVGAIVVVAMLIVPAATAHLLSDRLSTMLIIAVAASVTAAIFGCVWARVANSNAAGMMAVVAGLQFGAVVLVAPRYGLLSKAIHNVRLTLRILSEDVIAMLYRREENVEQSPAPAGERRIAQATRSECLEATGGHWLSGLALAVLRRRGELRALGSDSFALTDSGRRLGGSLVRAHRLWESYLDANFDLPADHLHEPASHVEHYIGPALQDRLAESLDRPHRDPHGRDIPQSGGEQK